MDRFTKDVRSKIMASVRAQGNRSTELALGSMLWKSGLRGYRKHWRVEGRPDFAWPSLNIAVFVDGCFWHGCRWHCRMPQGNRRYWQEKISRNAARDRTTNRLLRRTGWRVVRLWQHSLKDSDLVVRSIKSALAQ